MNASSVEYSDRRGARIGSGRNSQLGWEGNMTYVRTFRGVLQVGTISRLLAEKTNKRHYPGNIITQRLFCQVRTWCVSVEPWKVLRGGQQLLLVVVEVMTDAGNKCDERGVILMPVPTPTRFGNKSVLDYICYVIYLLRAPLPAVPFFF